MDAPNGFASAESSAYWPAIRSGTKRCLETFADHQVVTLDISVAKLDLRQLSEMVRDIDFVMLQTRTEGGQIAGRPMSNNRDVEYDGDSFFFLLQETRTFSDIRR